MRAEGMGLYNLSRNIGSSAGISVVTALITSNTQINHAAIASYITPFNNVLQTPAAAGMDPTTASGRAALDGVITNQATIISYMDDFKLLMIMSVICMPLVFLLRRPRVAPPPSDHAVVME
jgi:DHA2 family multidrug resistance protein